MIRQLGDLDPIPEGVPRRYLNDAGYVRLRWLVGPDQYVEAYEHRVVMGRPADMEVHHRDGDKANNDPSNLLVLTPAEHTRLHQDEYRAEGRFKGKARARAAADRRAVREAEWAGRADMYAAGMSTVEIGRAVGLDPSNIYRGLVKRGHAVRTAAEGTRLAMSKTQR